MDINEIIKSFGSGEITLSAQQADMLKTEFERMNAVSEEYVGQLKKAAVRACAEVLPSLEGDELEGILGALSANQLKSFCTALKAKKQLDVQLRKQDKAVKPSNAEFVI